MSAQRAASPLRVAIAGCGPKGLFALERLVHHVRRLGAGAEIHVFEPHRSPGAGPVYDLGQPPYLRMNIAAEHLDLWGADSAAVPAAERRTFAQWAAGVEDAGGYPPRALVGGYLADGYARLCRAGGPDVRITLRPHAVRSVRRGGRGWQVVATDRSTGDFDELLVATGHRSAADVAGDRAWEHAAPLVPAVFPVERHLSHAQVAPGARVAVRGFALTFLDAALALTEGRGGTFTADGHPDRLRYEASGHEPGVILPFSRTGRPMLSKPAAAPAGDPRALDAIAERGRAGILALPEGLDVEHDLVAALAATATAMLLATRGAARELRPDRARSASEAWLVRACRGVILPSERGAVGEMAGALQIGAGLRPPTLSWVMGHTWRGVYPAIVERLGGGAIPDASWPAFQRLAAQMERVAFGPPAVNAAKLLALITAGQVDLAHVRGGQINTRGGATVLSSERGARAVDVVVDAVLPAPGAVGDRGLLGQLVADGHCRVLAGRRGLDVGADGTGVCREGRPTAGLAVVGRPTEDSVIGNDSLVRALHPQADRWARRVGSRCAERTPAAA